MLVSQYIYTACGKDRTGAFSVFSKSKDITDGESAEIREVMMYKTPSGLPYEPTEQEIENLFPRKYGYFFLSSGRVCLAQVCYVGRVYSDMDGRFGNYIIHAFVFKKKNDFTPYSFFEHALFKRILTKKEWHDDPIPDELPEIELPENGGMLSMGEINSFLIEERKNKLKILIEAVINSSNENQVFLNEEYSSLKYWLKILSICLPKAMQNTISLCTHFTNTLIPGNASSRIQIRVNQPESGLFNYTQEAQKGRYAFDFVRNIIPASVRPGKYAASVVTLLSSGIFEAVKFVDNINKVMSAYSVNINEASDLINLNKADYPKFANADEIYNTVLIAERVSYETQIIADNLWTRKPQVNFNTKQKLDISAFIYKNTSKPKIKIEIIKTMLDNPEQYGLSTDSANSFRDDFNSKANFIFANYHDYLKAEKLPDYITKNKDSFIKLFLAFDFLTNLPEVKSSFQARSNTEETSAIRKIMNLTFERKSVSDLDLLMTSANSRVNGLGIALLSSEVQSAIKSGIIFTNILFAFDILKRLRPKTESAFAFLVHLIKTISDKDEFISLYVNAQNDAPDFYTKFENDNKSEASIADFCKKKDVFCFANQPLTQNTIKKYFDKYYITGADTGLFVKRLGEYLSTVKPEKRIIECISILDLLKLPVDADKKLLLPVYCIIIEAVFSVPYDGIYELSKKQEPINKIIEVYNAVKSAGGSLKQETRELAIITICGRILEKYNQSDKSKIFSFFKETQKDSDANSLVENFAMISSGKIIDTFIDCYFQPMANIFILGASGAREFNYDGVLKKIFGAIIEKGNLKTISDNIIYILNKSKSNTIVFVLYIFRKNLTASADKLDKRLGDIAKNYFEELSSGNRKKIFLELLDLAEKTEVEQFERYFEKFNSEHKGGLFGFLKGKNKK